MTNGSNADQVRELASVIERKSREATPDGDYEARRAYYLIQAILLVAEQLAGVRDAVLAVEQALYEEGTEEEM